MEGRKEGMRGGRKEGREGGTAERWTEGGKEVKGKRRDGMRVRIKRRKEGRNVAWREVGGRVGKSREKWG